MATLLFLVPLLASRLVKISGNMKQVPIKEFDEEINVIVIRKPKHILSIGAVFQSFRKLEILRVVEANVPAIGMHSFWGVPSLRVLGLLTSTLPMWTLQHFLGRFVQEQHLNNKRRQFQGSTKLAGTEFSEKQNGSNSQRSVQIFDSELTETS